jgi:hypothetical protein
MMGKDENDFVVYNYIWVYTIGIERDIQQMWQSIVWLRENPHKTMVVTINYRDVQFQFSIQPIQKGKASNLAGNSLGDTLW